MSIYKKILLKYWGYPDFRPLQEDIILSVCEEKKDTLGLLPTGGGKSVIFQVPALAMDGICLVVTPLIALMRDQVENLKKRDIKAAAIYSGMSRAEINITLDNCIYGGYKFLYLSPERLSTELFLTKMKSMRISLIAIDESHCISQWGYDFRPSYLKINELRAHLGDDVPFLALTATATPKVVDDIQEKLGFKEKCFFKKSFERKNLSYIVRNVEDKLGYMLKILKKQNGSGVVYVRNRKRTKEIALYLQQNGISADYYHAGLTPEVKETKQDNWKNDDIRIMVSTNAFGMGIDKSDVRIVIHIDVPDSLEAYFQEAGRGGRDEKRAYAVMLYNNSDKLKLEKLHANTFPDIDYMKRVYNALGNYYSIPVGNGKHQNYDFSLFDFCGKFNLQSIMVFNSLKYLQKEGLIEFNENVNISAKVHFKIQRDDLYKFQVENQKFDAFLKLLLRSYTGFFSDYVAINEALLAKRAGATEELIRNYLSRLSKMGVIYYIPKRNNAIVTYTQERIDNKHLKISKKLYSDRKKSAFERISAVINYAESTTKCRSKMLLEYFGEIDYYRCGECDVCKKRNELNVSQLYFDKTIDKIKDMISVNDYSYSEVVDNLDGSEESNLKIMEWLIDNEKLIVKNNVVKWTS